jgi:hypothetical protein
VEGCREAGIQCLEVPGLDWAEGLTYGPGEELTSWRDRAWHQLIDFVRKQGKRIDLFLSYLYPKQVDVSAIKDLSKLGIPSVNFFCDNVREFRVVPSEFSAFTLNWVPEYEAVRMYKDSGVGFLHLPMPCWIPTNLRNVPLVESERPTFIGSADILRRDLLGNAIAIGADLVIRGRGWSSNDAAEVSVRRSFAEIVLNQASEVRRNGAMGLGRKLMGKFSRRPPPAIPDERIIAAVSEQLEYFRITREAVVTIGINRVPTLRAGWRCPLSYSRLRDIEAPMLGACYLTERTKGLELMYESGHEIETYRTPEELRLKLSALVCDASRRLKMRQRAQEKALNELTVAKSLSRICSHLGLQNRGNDD